MSPRFAPIAGILDAAERKFGIRPNSMLLTNIIPGIDAARDVPSTCDILGEDGTAQSEVGVVCERNGGVFVLDPEEHCDRSEELVSESGIIRA